MPALKSFSAAEEEDDQLCPNPEADRYKPEAEDEEEYLDQKDEDDNEGRDEEDEDDVKRDEEEDEDEIEAEDEKALEEEDSKEISQLSISEEQSESEFMDIELGDIRRDVQCPICLGIIKKTRTVMECLHRFCRECIDKSMRLGNNECPACRKHCASRRSLRDDPKFDAFISSLFKNIDRFEEEELAFHEDELARNKQIQVSIAQVSQRQSEALMKRRPIGNDAGVLPRSQRSGSDSRRRRNCRNMEQNTSEAHGDDDNNNRGKSPSSDEPCAEILLRKRKRRPTTGSTAHPSSSCPNNNDNYADKGIEEAHHRDRREISPGLLWNPELLGWGRGGTRSNTRQGNNNQGASSKSVRNARLNRLVEYLGSLESNSAELDIHVKLISLDTKGIPNLPQPYLCCRPTLLVKQLREYVALQMQLQTEEVELLVSDGEDKAIEGKNSSSSTENLQSLKDEETLAKLKINCISSHEYLMVVCREKQIRVEPIQVGASDSNNVYMNE